MLDTTLPFIDHRQAAILKRKRKERRQKKIIKVCVIIGLLVGLYIIINLIVEIHSPPSHLIRTISSLI